MCKFLDRLDSSDISQKTRSDFVTKADAESNFGGLAYSQILGYTLLMPHIIDVEILLQATQPSLEEMVFELIIGKWSLQEEWRIKPTTTKKKTLSRICI